MKNLMVNLTTITIFSKILIFPLVKMIIFVGIWEEFILLGIIQIYLHQAPRFIKKC